MSSNDKAPALDDDLVSALGAELRPDTDAAALERVRGRLMASLPQDAEPLHIVRAEEGEWEPLQPGVKVKRLYVDPDTQAVTALWRLDPGAAVDAHVHDQDEECLVLEGDLQVGGELLQPGDYLLGQRGSAHPPVVSPSGALLLIRSEDYRNAA